MEGQCPFPGERKWLQSTLVCTVDCGSSHGKFLRMGLLVTC